MTRPEFVVGRMRGVTLRSLLGLAVLNLFALAVGAGLLWGLRGWRSWWELARLAGLAYMLGIAGLGVALTLGLVVGIRYSCAACSPKHAPTASSTPDGRLAGIVHTTASLRATQMSIVYVLPIAATVAAANAALPTPPARASQCEFNGLSGSHVPRMTAAARFTCAVNTCKSCWHCRSLLTKSLALVS